MAATLSQPQIGAGISASLSASSGAAANTANIQDSSTVTPTVGSSAGNVNKIYSAQLTIADSSTPQTLDLTSLTDPLGNAIVFGTIYAIKATIASDTTAGHDLLVGGAASNSVLTLVDPVLAGTDPGCLLIKYGSAGKTVDATHKNLKIAIAAGLNVLVNVTIIGK